MDTELGHKIDDYIGEHYGHLGVKPISVEECTAGCLKVMKETKCDKDIKSWTYQGKIKPW